MEFYRHCRSATNFQLENTRQAEKTLGTIISERIFVNVIGQRDNQLQLEGSWREKESVHFLLNSMGLPSTFIPI